MQLYQLQQSTSIIKQIRFKIDLHKVKTIYFLNIQVKPLQEVLLIIDAFVYPQRVYEGEYYDFEYDINYTSQEQLPFSKEYSR